MNLSKNKKSLTSLLPAVTTVASVSLVTALGIFLHEMRLDSAVIIAAHHSPTNVDSRLADTSREHHVHADHAVLKKVPGKSPSVSGREQTQRKNNMNGVPRTRGNLLPTPAVYL